jgi:hypothetical protein
MECSMKKAFGLVLFVLILSLYSCPPPLSPETPGGGPVVVDPEDPDDPPPAETVLRITLGGLELAGGAELAFKNTQRYFSRSLDLEATNIGVADLDLSSISVSGAGFSLGAGVPTSATLAPGQSITLTARFGPTDSAIYEGSLLIHGGNPASPLFSASLRGRGASESMSLRYSADGAEHETWRHYAMADVWAGERGAAETITLTNFGYTPFVIASVEIAQPSQVSLGSSLELPHTLDGLTGLDIPLVFEPQSFGPKPAELRITDQAGSTTTLYIDAEGTWYPIRKLSDANGDFVKYDSSIETLKSHRGELLVNGNAGGSSRYLYRYDGANFSRAKSSGADLGPMGRSASLGADLIFQSGGALYRYGDTISQVAAGYHDFESPTVSGSRIYFLDDKSSGYASQSLYVYEAGSVSKPAAAAGSDFSGFASALSALPAGGALVYYSYKLYSCDGSEVIRLTEAAGCSYSNGLYGSREINGELYFIGLSDASKRKLYRLSGGQIADASAFEAAGMAECVDFLGVIEGELYIAGKDGSGGPMALRYGAAGIASVDISGASGLASFIAASWDYAPIAWNGGIVARGYDGSSHLPLFVKDGETRWLDSPRPGYSYTFKGPYAHGSLLYFEGYALDEAYSGRHQILESAGGSAKRLYAGQSGYSSGFSQACAIGDTLYFLGRDTFNSPQVYSFSYVD